MKPLKLVKHFFLIIYSLWGYLLFFSLGAVGLLIYPFAYLVFGNRFVDSLYRYYYWWGNTFYALLGIKHLVYGNENLEDGKAYIFVGSHSSAADMIITAISFRRPFRPLGKAELTRVPILGVFIKSSTVSVNRGNPESRAKSVAQLMKIVKKGTSIVIFPEGTRNASPNPLKSFYEGAFRIAIELQTPIVPWVIVGAKAIQQADEWIIHPGTTKSYFCRPFETKGLTMEDLPKLKEEVYQYMWDKIIELDDDFAHLRKAGSQETSLSS